MKKNQEKKKIYEVRCRNCGKLLFKFQKNFDEDVAVCHNHVTIVARCTRTSCTKKDNVIIL